MEKEGFYFPHFCNARHDRKIKRLRKELGVEGYGIYFMLLETLRDQHDLRYPLEDIDLLAEEFNVSEQKVRVTICNYQLFEIDEEQKFFSPKMLLYLEPYYKMKEQRREAGLKSAAKRKLSEHSTTVEQPFNDRSTTVQQSKVKESKEKEIKVNKSKEDFNQILLPYANDLGPEYMNFAMYWMEEDEKGRERWQSEKFFNIKRRITTWMNNATKFAPNKPQQQLGKLQQNMLSLKNVHDQLTEEIQNGTFVNPYK
jgi:hypothetical protein